MKNLILSSLLGLSIPLASACGPGHYSETTSAASSGIIGFGFIGGIFSTLIGIILVLSIILVFQKAKGGKDGRINKN